MMSLNNCNIKLLFTILIVGIFNSFSFSQTVTPNFTAGPGNQLEVEVFISNPCDGLNNGEITFTIISASGGSATLQVIRQANGFFNFLNTPPHDTDFAVGEPISVGNSFTFTTRLDGNGLEAGNYGFSITDGSFTINELGGSDGVDLTALTAIAISATGTTTDNTSCLSPNGQVEVLIENGSLDLATGRISYTWNADNGLAGLPLTINDVDATTNYTANLLTDLNNNGFPALLGLPGGQYEIVVTDNYSVCSASLVNDPTLLISDPSPSDRDITNPGVRNICTGSGTTIVLENSQTPSPATEPDIFYQVQVDGSNVGAAQIGDGTNLTFNLLSSDFSDGSVITIVATQGACTPNTMSDNVTINLVPAPDGTISNNGPICAGAAVDLTFTATVGTGPFDIVVDGTTYNGIASGAVFATFTEGVDFTGNQTFTLTSITDTGVVPNCAATVSETTDVVVNPEPVGTISNDGPICPGGSVDLTFTATVGTGPFDIVVDGTTYNGIASGAVFVTFTEGVDFTGDQTFTLTSITDTGVVPNCAATVSETTDVVVNPEPAGTISNDGPICAGAAVDLTFTATVGTGPFDIVVDGTTYNGIASGAVFATFTEGVDFTGNQTFTLTSITDVGVTPNCAATVVETTDVLVLSAPAGTISNDGPICAGAAVDLTFTATVGTGPFDIVVDGTTYNGIASGAVFVTFTEGVDFTGNQTFTLTSITDTGVTPNCAATVSETTDVVVNPEPAGTISNDGPICAGAAVDLTFTATVGTGPFDIVVDGTTYNGIASGAVFVTFTEGVDFTGNQTFTL
ncbi:MAG: hypothetical protein RLO81_09625, partial [Fulvivirga sp.]|uniref:beta strand repeat-containing protein n=1 Tax=Fulvivirga sp. TaxID=1931237 RepID=UPI0032ED16A5